MRLVGGTPVVTLDGIVDLASIPALQDHLTRALHGHPDQTLAVDLDGVTALDDCGLGVLLGAATRARDAGGSLVLVCSAERLRTRLASTGLDRVVQVRSALASDRAPLFHAALPADWEAALAAGSYTVSTRGVTLEQEGFIHCSYRHQVESVVNTFYSDLAEVTLLTIDPDHLGSPVVEELPAPEAPQAFPHVYGPIPVAAVTAATPWPRDHVGVFRLP